MTLEWPLVTIEPFLFLARAALERLCQRLETRGLGCQRLDFTLHLEPDGLHERSISLPSPTRDVKTLLTLVRLDLEAQPPGAPVIGYVLQAHPDQPRAAQLSLFGATILSPERFATTLAKLFALVGKGRIGSPRTVDGHRPERFELVEYKPPPPPKVRSIPPSARGLLIIRTLKPAVPLTVELRNEAASESKDPRFLRSLGTSKPIEGDILVASGPWALEENWWTQQPLKRDYWDVEIESGELLRIYQDQNTRKWFMDGIYD